MGKRKRSRSVDSDSSEDYSAILKKVKKLERRLKRSRRISSSSESDNIDAEPERERTPSLEELFESEEEVEGVRNGTENEVTTEGEPSLEPEILEILGDDPANENTFGENLHKDITPRWTHILKNGLPKEKKAELLKQYLVPENCNIMKAPKLNLEIKAALSEINLKKEIYNENKQNQLSSCLAAVGKAVNIALNSSGTTSQDILKPLSDAGRLLCDFHYRESQSRRYAIINTLNKQVRDTVKNTKIDEYLFGSDLAEHLKSSKAITKSGTELKFTPARTQFKPTASQSHRGALNSRGASRAAASEPRTNPSARRPAPAASGDRRRDTSSRSYNSRQRSRKR